MATRKKAGAKIKENKSEPIEISGITDTTTKKVSEDESQIIPLKFPVVGIGASAGGLAAFEAFFTGMPEGKDPDIAFVIVQHLAPDYKSILTEIIRRYTKMKVFEVEDGMTVKPSCVYIIPPNQNMALFNGILQLFDIPQSKGLNMPIDFFFKSLAKDQHAKAVCIILSGTGSDGTLGLRAVKGEGGLAIVQSPDTTEYDGMPESAIATGLVDYQLPPNEMAKQLISFVTHISVISNKRKEPGLTDNENTHKKIFLLIRNHTGHDFSKYKTSTIDRRIERRMAVHRVETMADYIKYLQVTPAEIHALFQDLLIGVTSFFRDEDAFNKLEEVIIPKLFEGKPAGSTIRVWCAGCSTGEEAYSIAILLQEHLEKIKENYQIQVFATDIDEHAINISRAGLYPSSIITDLTKDRIERFFTLEPGNNTYRINKSIRDLLIFSVLSVIKDPPFSKLDLISCRNLMIYLSNDLQKKIIPLFHYALNPRGILFLGSAETVGGFESLFKTLDRKLKFYQRTEDFQADQAYLRPQILPPATKVERTNNKKMLKKAIQTKKPFKEIVEQYILRECSVAGILVNENGDILYIHGRTGMYLEPGQGEVGTSNVLKMAREGLKPKLTLALKNAAIKKETIHLSEINVKTNGHFTKVNLVVKQLVTGFVSNNEQPLYIILIKEINPQEHIIKPKTKDAGSENDLKTHLIDLESELRINEEYLQAANEELETSNEELKSSNEELQAVNEELQSTNEELETSKEEMQSINEELSTVNSELQAKVHDLSQVNNDMNNLLAGTNIATIFLDYQQKILRFTPTANKIINLILSDVGRPVAHIVSNLINYDQLTNDVNNVLDTLVPKNIQVQTIEGKWYNMIIQPYRTIENVIEGAVLTFVDITEAKNAKDMLAISEISYRTLFETAGEGILILDGVTGKINNVNPFLIELLGYSKEQFLGKEIWSIGIFKDIAANKEKFFEVNNEKNIRYENLPLETADGRKIDVEFISNAYEIDQHKIIQCNIRKTSSQNESDKT